MARPSRRPGAPANMARVAVLAAAVFRAMPAAAETYPARPITIVVPFPPGGSTSMVARIVTDRMAEVIGQPFVVDNRGGAGGALGTRQVAKSTPDGYTIALGYTGTLAIGPALFPNVGYDVRTDFAPIGRIGVAPSTVVVHPSFPARSIAELIAYAKGHPGEVNFGSAGIGTVGHVAGEYFAIATGIRLTHIPYKGTGQAVTDLLGGHIPLSFSPIPAVHESAKNGLLRMLAVTSITRSSLTPDLPTVAESGVPGFEAVLRYGLVAPAGTPRPVIDRLSGALQETLALADVRGRLALEGAEPLPGTPEEYAADIAGEEALWSKVIKASGAKAE
jgi:tripartite-type tricarboxylate transporter receptor subunit TctC